MNVKNMQNEPDGFPNGSFTERDGMEMSAQGKFEMLQSSIYPDCYGVPCEYFFVIKVRFQATKQVKKCIILKKLCLVLKDKTKQRG